MLFPTFTFGLFFLVVFVLHVMTRRNKDVWQMLMICSSYIFYAWFDWRLSGLLAFTTAFSWAIGEALGGTEHPPKSMLILGVTVNLAVLGVFKYMDFFAESINRVTGSAIPLLNVVLPIGISFYTFQAISYITDVYRQRIPRAHVANFIMYLSFFPQLVAGPIVRPNEFMPQIDSARRRNWYDTGTAAWLIGRGLTKKVVISNYLAENVVDPVWEAPSVATKMELITAAYGYAIQIYADFSGYTDMAIGLALMLGFRFPENFNNPYRALSVGDFWQRWHMTLSRWLRDYLYVPLGGNRRGKMLTYRNLLVTMLLGGLWHGARLNFVAWGLMLGLILVLERVIFSRFGAVDGQSLPGRRFAHWFVTFHLICLSWILFRAPEMGAAQEFLSGLASAPWGAGPPLLAVAVIIGVLAAQLVNVDRIAEIKQSFQSMEPILQGALLAVWIAVVIAAGPDGVSPFIYFQF